MNRNKSLFVLVLIVYAGGCATLEPKAPPPPLGFAPVIYLLDRLPSEEEKVGGYAVPDSYFGVSDHPPTGALAVGLLFGPLGMLSNVARFQQASKNRAERHTALFQTNLVTLMNSGSNKYAIRSAKEPSKEIRYELVPTALIYYQDDKTFQLTCFLHVTLYASAHELWRARYAANSSRAYTVDNKDIDTIVREDLSECLAKSVALFELHSGSDASMFKDAEIDTGDITLYVPVMHSLLPDRLVYNDFLGLHELSKRNWRRVKLK
jgi:hypothetical protein